MKSKFKFKLFYCILSEFNEITSKFVLRHKIPERTSKRWNVFHFKLGYKFTIWSLAIIRRATIKTRRFHRCIWRAAFLSIWRFFSHSKCICILIARIEFASQHHFSAHKNEKLSISAVHVWCAVVGAQIRVFTVYDIMFCLSVHEYRAFHCTWKGKTIKSCNGNYGRIELLAMVDLVCKNNDHYVDIHHADHSIAKGTKNVHSFTFELKSKD